MTDVMSARNDDKCYVFITVPMSFPKEQEQKMLKMFEDDRTLRIPVSEWNTDYDAQNHRVLSAELRNDIDYLKVLRRETEKFFEQLSLCKPFIFALAYDFEQLRIYEAFTGEDYQKFLSSL